MADTKDLADIRAIIRFRGDYRSSLRFPDANIDVEAQAAFGEFWELVADTHEGYFDVSSTVTTTSSVAFVALPTDCWRIQAVDRQSGSDWIQLDQIGISDRLKYGSATGEPLGYIPTARGLDLYPTPNATYTLRVIYTPTAPTLAEGTDVNYFNGWEEYTITGALLRLDQNEEKPTGERERELERQRQRIIRGASGRKSQEPEYLPPREYFDEDWWP